MDKKQKTYKGTVTIPFFIQRDKKRKEYKEGDTFQTESIEVYNDYKQKNKIK